MTIQLHQFIDRCYEQVPELCNYKWPWEMTADASDIVAKIVERLSDADYRIEGNTAIHKTAVIEKGAVLKEAAFIGKGCHVAAGAYIRGGVYLGEGVKIGPGCELKSSFIFDKSRLAHFNYVGDSIVGADVNFEAGAVVANYFNEMERDIELNIDGEVLTTDVRKFGAIVGDHARIGANAVLDPGSVLRPGQIVGRLEHFSKPQR